MSAALSAVNTWKCYRPCVSVNSFNPSFPPDALFSQQVLPPFTCPYGVHALLHLWPPLLQAMHRLVGKCRRRDKGRGYVVKRQEAGMWNKKGVRPQCAHSITHQCWAKLAVIRTTCCDTHTAAAARSSLYIRPICSDVFLLTRRVKIIQPWTPLSSTFMLT